ncbi:MAG: Ig-like domain-containing protein [Methanobrevibacter sp.]|nr:Ig-like domain-containing protein [Methanobrevibacter sp.]
MFEFNTKNYVDNVATTPKQYWEELHQATLDTMWNDTTQVYTIKEQNALPFEDEYTEYEAWVSTVSDDLINYSKVYSDFVRLFYRDLTHKQNYKGQYYKFALDGEHEETYICYDRMNLSTLTADFKVVRCNNVLTWVDEYGNIITLPCYLGTDVTSTNNLIGKDGIVPNARMIILVQANDFTKSIVKNQRFMFEHSTAFKVEEVNNFMQEQGTDGQVTCVKIYINYSAIIPNDNTELNICDYYKVGYTVDIDQDNIEQVNGFTGQLTATVKNLNEVVDNMEVIWETSDKTVVTIDSQGNYQVVGLNGDKATITCRLKENTDVYSSITIEVVGTVISSPTIIVSPNDITVLKEKQSVAFIPKVYNEGEELHTFVNCIPSNANPLCYTLIPVTNGYLLTVLKKSTKPLILTFSASGCADYVVTIKLMGLL